MTGPDRYELLLLGDPVAHSRSPAMHTAALAAAGLSGSYTARRVDEVGVMEAAGEIRSGQASGANITMPHKALAARLCDELSPDAERAGSVNTWVGRAGRLVGHSTDVAGVARIFERFPPGPAVVLGAGGAAAAALVALEGREMSIRARSVGAAHRLVTAIDVDAEPFDWSVPIETPSIVVNCTPIGMRHGDRLPDRFLRHASGLLDMAYGRHATQAVIEARARRIPHADGLDLLVAQAGASFELWTGRPAPVEVMERAARRRD